MNLIKELSIEQMRGILAGKPKFIQEALDQNETSFNPRSQTYIERTIRSATIQLDVGGEEYYRTTMPYESSFYDECIF